MLTLNNNTVLSELGRRSSGQSKEEKPSLSPHPGGPLPSDVTLPAGTGGQETTLPPDPVPVTPQLALEVRPSPPPGHSKSVFSQVCKLRGGIGSHGDQLWPHLRERLQTKCHWDGVGCVPCRGFYRLVISVIAQTLVLHPWGENHVCP